MRESSWFCTILVLVILMCVASCVDSSRKPGASPSSAAGVKAEAAGIGKSADAIDSQTAQIDKQAPEVKPHTEAISVETAALRATEGRLNKVVSDLQAKEKETAQLKSDLASTQKKVAELQAAHNSLLAKILAGLAVAAVIGGTVCVMLLRDLKLAALCGALFFVAISAEFLLQWAEWFALAIAIVVVLLAVWLFVIQHRTLSEVVAKANDLGEDLHSPQAARMVESTRSKLSAFISKLLPRPVPVLQVPSVMSPIPRPEASS